MINESSANEPVVMDDASARRQRAEDQIKPMRENSGPGSGMPGFEFVIEADGQELWSGQNVQTRYLEFLEKCPDKKLMISWRSKELVLGPYQFFPTRFTCERTLSCRRRPRNINSEAKFFQTG